MSETILCSIDSRAIRPINHAILVRKCFSDHIRKPDGDVAIFLPDETVEYTHFCEILAVAKDCKLFHQDDVGKLVVGPEMHNDLQGIGDDVHFLIREQCFLDEFGGKPYMVDPNEQA